MTIEFNFSRLKNVYFDALHSYDKSVAFDVTVGRGQFLFLMFLAEDDEKDTLFLYMRNTLIMRKLKMYGSHKNGDFKFFISDEVQERMVAELQLKERKGSFEFNTFLNQLNEAIPLKVDMNQKVNTLRNNRDVIQNVAINDIDKTVLIGTKTLPKGKPQDKTLRKLYIFTEESESTITEFISNLKKANMTVAWTTEDQRFRAADINSLINSINVKGQNENYGGVLVLDSIYVKNLIMIVIRNSESDVWQEAVTEWEIYDCVEYDSCSEACICGKENIKYLYTIKNIYNGTLLFPIGSSCIKKFNRTDLREETSLIEGQFKLLHAVEKQRYLTLSSELFSRKLLRWLYEQGAFDTPYNHYNGENDYEFMLKMFNKRDKDSITINQDKKIKAIILNSIKPFLQERLSDKIR